MPIFNTTTNASRSIWKSPDGSREIFEVALDYEGQQIVAKTYSHDIAAKGWTGSVETYEKAGKRGIETFVKQPPKEGGYPSSNSTGSGSPSQGTTKAAYVPKDEKAIQAMWSIGQAVQLSVPTLSAGKPVELGDLYTLATELMSMVDAVKASASEEKQPAPDTVYEPVEEADPQVALMDDVDTTFPGAKELPWTKS